MADSTLINKMVRAAKLDVNLYESVEADTKATKEALIVVIIVSVLSGIGAGIAGLMTGAGALKFLWGLLGGIASALIGWIIWSWLTWLIGTKLLKGPRTSATWGELLRTIGFAHSPGVLRLFVFIPVIGGIIAFAVMIWSLIAAVIAVRQALDFSTWRALGTCILGWIIMVVIVALVGLLIPGARWLL